MSEESITFCERKCSDTISITTFIKKIIGKQDFREATSYFSYIYYVDYVC